MLRVSSDQKVCHDSASLSAAGKVTGKTLPRLHRSFTAARYENQFPVIQKSKINHLGR